MHMYMYIYVLYMYRYHCIHITSAHSVTMHVQLLTVYIYIYYIPPLHSHRAAFSPVVSGGEGCGLQGGEGGEREDTPPQQLLPAM